MKMTVNDYISRMLENNEENPQIIVIYDDNHNIYYFGKAAYAPLNCWFAFKNAHMVGNELRINDIREEENGNTEGKETKIGKSVYDVDIHTVNGWDTYQVNANFACVQGTRQFHELTTKQILKMQKQLTASGFTSTVQMSCLKNM